MLNMCSLSNVSNIRPFIAESGIKHQKSNQIKSELYQG